MGTHLRSAVFLDRDGVLNDVVLRDGKSYPPPSVEGLVILPEAFEALAALRDAGLPRVVVTNQPDVGRGTQTREGVQAIHARLRERLPIDSIEVCFHTAEDCCACRKPEIGMLRTAAQRMDLDLTTSFLVGDRWCDIEAGRRAGCTTFWIDRGYRERAPESPDHVVSHVGEAARIILRRLGAARISATPGTAAHAGNLERNKEATSCDAS